MVTGGCGFLSVSSSGTKCSVMIQMLRVGTLVGLNEAAHRHTLSKLDLNQKCFISTVSLLIVNMFTAVVDNMKYASNNIARHVLLESFQKSE